MCIHTANQRQLEALRGRYYFPVLEAAFGEHYKQHGVPAVADYLTDIMRESQTPIEALINWRVAQGIIEDKSQARKSLAGNGFQALVFLTLTTMQQEGLIPAQVIFSLKPKSHPIINQFATINIGDELLKPDLDLMAYAENCDTVTIYSIKTSLRERAGQTHRWKLLMDIATAPDADSIRQKYDIRYAGGRNFLMNLVTTNFYNEITAPQQRGLLRFFDRVYLTKSNQYAAPIINFSKAAEHLDEIYGR